MPGGSGGWCPPVVSDSYIARLNFIALLYQTIFLHPYFLPLANGLARQTSLSYHLSSLVFLCSAPPPPFFSLVYSLSLDLSLSLPLLSFLSVSPPLFPSLCSLSFNSCLTPLSLSLLPFSLQKINFFYIFRSLEC